VAPTIPKSRGLRELKAEIMKSSSVFSGEIVKNDRSRVPIREFDLTQLGGASIQQAS